MTYSKTVETNNKIQHFGVVMTPLSRENICYIMQITAFKAILAQRINVKGAKIIKILSHK